MSAAKIKKKLEKNEMWFRICKVLFRRKTSCAKKIAKEIGYTTEEVRNRFFTLKKDGIIKPTSKGLEADLTEKGRNGTFCQYYLLTETAKKAMEEILKEQENKRLIQ